MKTNAQVAAAFVARETAQNKSLRATEWILYSYATPIAYKDVFTKGGTRTEVVIISTQHHSATTTRHHGHLMHALMDAGYDGCAPWPDRVDDTPDAWVTTFGIREGRSDPNAPAVVWRKLTEEEREAKEREFQDELQRIREWAVKEFAR